MLRRIVYNIVHSSVVFHDHKWNGIMLNKTLSLRLQSSLGLDRNRNVKGLVKGDSGERWSTPIENYFLPDFKSLGRGRLSSQSEARTARQGGAVILPVGIVSWGATL